MSRRLGPEAGVLKAVTAYAEARGCIVVRVNSGLTVLKNADGTRRAIRNAATGTADLLLCCPPSGLFLAVEVKTEAGPGRRRTSPTRPQRAFLRSVRAAGGYGEVVRSVDDLVEVLDVLGCPPIWVRSLS